MVEEFSMSKDGRSRSNIYSIKLQVPCLLFTLKDRSFFFFFAKMLSNRNNFHQNIIDTISSFHARFSQEHFFTSKYECNPKQVIYLRAKTNHLFSSKTLQVLRPPLSYGMLQLCHDFCTICNVKYH